MTEVTRMVQDEMQRTVSGLGTLPADLRVVVDRHFDNLMQLALSLQAAGQHRDTIRAMVTQLISSYERDLLAVIETRR